LGQSRGSANRPAFDDRESSLNWVLKNAAQDMAMKNAFVAEFLRSAKAAPRLYFAPLVGAIKAVRAEFRRVSKRSDTSE